MNIIAEQFNLFIKEMDTTIQDKKNKDYVPQVFLKNKEMLKEIDIIFKALADGIYTKNNLDNYPYACLLRSDGCLVLFDDIYRHEYRLQDYGKTWALTKEELI